MFSCLFSFIRIVFMRVFVIYIEYFPYCLFVSNSQVIGCEDRLQNDLYCVGWGVKLYSIQSKVSTFIYSHLQGNPDQELFTIPSGVLAGNDTRRPLPESQVIWGTFASAKKNA